MTAMKIQALPLAILLTGCVAVEQPVAPKPFANQVVSFTPGQGATYGQDKMPGVVLGPPNGGGPLAGSLDVVSLGKDGTIVLALEESVVDGPGVDLIVFENPFPGWLETGYVAVSEDGNIWHEFPCDPLDKAHDFPGCAGVHPVLANAENGVDPTDPVRAGGDDFDLADLGVKSAKYVRIRDSGFNPYAPPTGGFDLDAVAVVHAAQ